MIQTLGTYRHTGEDTIDFIHPRGTYLAKTFSDVVAIHQL